MSIFGIVDTFIYRFNKKRTENYEEQIGLANEASQTRTQISPISTRAQCQTAKPQLHLIWFLFQKDHEGTLQPECTCMYICVCSAGGRTETQQAIGEHLKYMNDLSQCVLCVCFSVRSSRDLWAYERHPHQTYMHVLLIKTYLFNCVYQPRNRRTVCLPICLYMCLSLCLSSQMRECVCV